MAYYAKSTLLLATLYSFAFSELVLAQPSQATAATRPVAAPLATSETPAPAAAQLATQPTTQGVTPGAAAGPGVQMSAIDNEVIRTPPARRRPKRTHKVLLVTGLIMFSVGYVGSALSVPLNPGVFDAKLLIPLAGPWMSMGDLGKSGAADADRGLAGTVLAIQGLLQATGLVLTIVGLSMYGSSKNSEYATEQSRSIAWNMSLMPGGAFGTMRGKF